MNHAALRELALGSDWFMRLLHAGRATGLAEWAIGAGAVRNLVWDHLHGYAAPTPLADVDFVFFDACEAREQQIAAALAHSAPDVPWEVTNQAFVHRWYGARFGREIAPIPSLAAGIAGWPEFATCVGITLHADGQPGIIAPHGLDDLFGMRIRRNPRSVTQEAFVARVRAKNFKASWPQVREDLG